MGLHTYLDLKSVPKNIARILICYDALLQLRQKKIRPRKNTYIGLAEAKKVGERQKNLQLDQVIEKQSYCEACALGTLLISRARIFNSLKVSSFMTEWGLDFCTSTIDSGYQLMNSLLPYFDKEQLSLVEACFEGYDQGMAGRDCKVDYDKVIKPFARKYETAESRLIAILKNIISNDGLFIPEKNLSRGRKKKVDKKETVVKENQGE